MSDAAKRTVVVANQDGMHLRVATMIVKEAKRFKSRILIAKDVRAVDATEIFEVLSLAGVRGDELTLEASGEDAADALDAVEQLFLRKFDED